MSLLCALGCGGQHAGGGVDILDGMRETKASNGASAGKTGSPSNAFQSPTGVVAAGSGGTTGAPLSDACIGQTQKGQEVQLDMYVMLDRSASMAELTGAGPSKWDAIRAALTDFLQDPQSSGLGVGLQYFPLKAAGVPDHCQTDGECGNQGGKCLSKACRPSPTGFSSFGFRQCLTDADCPTESAGCASFGVCSKDDMIACFDIGTGGCDTNGDCDLFTRGVCTGFASCTSTDYSKPAVPIDALPRNTAILTSSLMAEKTLGSTPTPAALSGALAQAAQQASAHPDHRVIVILATDGLPTQCLPTTVQSASQAVSVVGKVAAQGFTGTPSIPTYVIGVFAPTDTNANSNLNQIAVSGGTSQAFIVDQSQDVSEQLLTALSKIRTGVLACEYQVPSAPEGETLDFTLVNVELTTSTLASQTLPYVGAKEQCSKSKLGWYYDANPSDRDAPTKILMCPKTCDTVRAAKDGSIEIRLGCATQGPE